MPSRGRILIWWCPATILPPCTCITSTRLRKDEGRKQREFVRMLERSLGSNESFPVVYARTRFLQVAAAEGIRCPATEVITNESDLKELRRRASDLPMVLKVDVSSGGEGVRVVRNLGGGEAGIPGVERSSVAGEGGEAGARRPRQAAGPAGVVATTSRGQRSGLCRRS